ncbi:MAG: DUF3604 domain-containing protein [Pseudomonadota bacterium]
MPPIERRLMGDVWPAVEPGSARSDYGSAKLAPTTPCPVRSFQTLEVTYTVGRFGLDDTGGIRISFRWVNDCGPLQTDDPSAMNYVRATASNGVPLELYVEPYGYRPWSLALRVTVTGGFMREGDTITVVFGDTSGGSPGFRMQTISETAFEFKVSADVCATGQFNELDDQLFLPIVAGPPTTWSLTAPGPRRPGEVFAIGLRVEDRWGNPAQPDLTELHLSSDIEIEGLPKRIKMPEGQRTLRIDGLSVESAGRGRISLHSPNGERLAQSNPLIIRDEQYAGYWGDLHGQSGETVGIGSIEEYLCFARDVAFLDVCGHQGNDFQITNAFWDHLNNVTAEMNVDGAFIVFPGYEWSGNTPVGGDHNVFFRHEGRTIRRSSHAMLTDRADLDSDATTLDQLFKALKDEDCVLWSHIGGRPADVGYAHDSKLKTAVEVHSNWGTFEWVLTDSLTLGHRVGVVASSDGHKGRPGAGAPGATEFGAYGGLTCFLAPALTRDGIFEAMRRRHHYGTSGSRIHLDVRAAFDVPADLYTRDPEHFPVDAVICTEAMMGDIVRLNADDLHLKICVDAPTAIERIDVLNGAHEIKTIRTYREEELATRMRIMWCGAEYRGRGRNTRWQGSIDVENATIDTFATVNHWNPERRLEQTKPNQIVFESVTSGNFAGVDLRLSDPTATIRVTSNHVSGELVLADLGIEDHILDAGGLERRIVIRRLPDEMHQNHLETRLTLPVSKEEDRAIWVRVTTLDGHQAWSSPIYLTG